MENPYEAPASMMVPPPKDDEEETARLASRGDRLGAAMIDGIIGIIVVIPLWFALGMWDYIKRGQEAPVEIQILNGVIGFGVFIAIHIRFLQRNGQTIGKKLAGIRIVDMAGDKARLKNIVLLRYLPISLVGYIPIVGQVLPLVDILMIFRKDRRCLHDLLAGTQVMKVPK